MGKMSSYLRGVTIVAMLHNKDGAMVEVCRFMGGLMTE